MLGILLALAAAPPHSHLDIKYVGERGPHSRKVLRALSRVKRRLEYCSHKHPALAGKGTARVTTAPNGRVAKVRVTGKIGPAPGVRCIEKTLRTLMLPRGKATTLNFVIEAWARKGAAAPLRIDGRGRRQPGGRIDSRGLRSRGPAMASEIAR